MGIQGLARTITELPPDYDLVEEWWATDTGNMVRLNIYGLGLMGLAFAILSLFSAYYQAQDARLTITSLPSTGNGLIASLSALVVMIVLHELMHGVGIAYYGHAVKFGIKPKYLVAYATTDGGFFWQHQFIVIALLPLVTLTPLFFLGMLLAPDADTSALVMLMAVFNIGGAIGDLWMVFKVRRYASTCLVEDLSDSIKIYVPQST